MGFQIYIIYLDGTEYNNCCKLRTCTPLPSYPLNWLESRFCNRYCSPAEIIVWAARVSCTARKFTRGIVDYNQSNV